jgi:hypothetical protein
MRAAPDCRPPPTARHASQPRSSSTSHPPQQQDKVHRELCPCTWNGNPLVDVRTGAGHADVRLGGLWNRHVWKKDTRARAGRFIKYQNR